VHAQLYNATTGCVENTPDEDRDEWWIGLNDMDAPFAPGDPIPVSWHAFELLPGDYALTYVERLAITAVHAGGNISTLRTGIRIVGSTMTFTVRAGQINYAGDFILSSEADFPLTPAGQDVSAAVAAYPNLDGDFVVTPVRMVRLTCVPDIPEGARVG